MKEKFIDKNFHAASLEIIHTSNDIIDDYSKQGFDLTLRQLYYQFVSKGLIANTQKSYDKLGSMINDARLAGLIDWKYIKDRTRHLRKKAVWDDAGELMEAAIRQFRVDKWQDQNYYPEVWIEKDALIGVIESQCEFFDVPYTSCRGFSSQSFMYEAANRFWSARRKGKIPIVLHLGDHDPSGVDMTRDIEERLNLLSSGKVEVRRLALNMDQVRKFNLPPNPAKLSDSRAKKYISKYGQESWELDALEPRVITKLIKEEIESLIEPRNWRESEEKEEEQKQKLQDCRDSL